MEHSKMFEKIKRWYETHLWTAEMVHDAMDRGLITEEEYMEIIQAYKE